MNHETERRAYWTQQMELAFDFMQQAMKYPVEECGETLASMIEATDDLEIEYAQTPIAGDLPRVFYLREGLIPHLVAAAREMNERGWILKIEDGFRSVEMQTAVAKRPGIFDSVLDSVVWENGGETPSRELMLRRLSALCATAPKIGTHMSGSAIDISVLRREDGSEVGRGGPYLEMSEKTPMLSPFVSPQEQENRREITGIMARHGFIAYPYEFWHYNAGDAYDEFINKTGQSARYGAIHWNAATSSITPVENPTQSLHSPDDIGRCIEKFLQAGE